MEVIKIKKVQLSVLVILCTIISVSFMMFNYLDNKQQLSNVLIQKNNEKKVGYKESNGNEINKKIKTEDKSTIEGLLEENIEINTEANAEISNNKDEKNKNDQNDIDINTNDNEENKDTESIDNNKDIKENTYEEQQNSKIDIDMEEDTTVFKMDAEKIVDELTLNQKKILLSVGMKFSPSDYAKMREYLYMSDREKGISLALELAEKRLTNNEYKKIADTLDEYIDISAIEKKD